MTVERSGDRVTVSCPREGVAVVEFAGEHDLTTKEATHALLRRLVADNDAVVVDLCAATFIDSSFISCLLTADREAAGRGSEVRLLVSGAPSIAAALRVSGVEERLTVITQRDQI